MPNLFVFTAADADAQRNLERSIRAPVPSDLVYESFDPELHSTLRSIEQKAGGFFAWGATPAAAGKREKNRATWESLSTGDYALCAYEGAWRYVAKVLGKFNNPVFADRLWGSKTVNHLGAARYQPMTWQYMYFMEKPAAIEPPIPYGDVADYLNSSPQGFSRMAKGMQAIEHDYGSVNEFVYRVLLRRPISATLDAIEEELVARREFDATDGTDAREWQLASIVRRRGQREFRAALLRAYDGKCAITGCDAQPALEAAHIIPYLGERTNEIQNGLLLRADIHTLFDLGLIIVHPESLTVQLDPDLVPTLYATLDGAPLRLPDNQAFRPSAEALEQRFKRRAALAVRT